MPALSINRSIGPKRSRSTSAERRMVAGCARSHVSTSTRACGIALRICVATSRASGSLRHSMITRYPARASSCAVTRPIPCVVPVITASPSLTGSEEGVDEAQGQQALVGTEQLVLLEFTAHGEAAEMGLRTEAPGKIRVLVAGVFRARAQFDIDLRQAGLGEHVEQREVQESQREGAQCGGLHIRYVRSGLAEVDVAGFECKAVQQTHAGDGFQPQVAVVECLVNVELAGADADAYVEAVVGGLGRPGGQRKCEQCQWCLHVPSVVTTILPICWFD